MIRRRGVCARCLGEGRLELVDGRELCRVCARRARRADGDQLRIGDEPRELPIDLDDWGGFGE